MQRRVGAFLLSVLFFAPVLPAAAESLPEIKTSAGNRVPECVTPGRLLAYLKSRNPNLDPRYERLAAEYMRLGEKLGLRWDYAFYQMILETGTLTYRRDVKPNQNNFAGLGATGRGERGDSFPDISSGVHAHLQHLLLYAGEHIDNPIADRTRKVQEWGVLKSWQAGIKREITFTDLALKWAPGTRSYVRMLAGIAEKFHDDFCNAPDPRPELLAEVRGRSKPAEAAGFDRPTGADLARRAVESGKAQDEPRYALGASEVGRDASKVGAAPYKLLNAEADKPAPQTPPAASDAKSKSVAFAATGALPKLPAGRAAPPAGSKPLLDAKPAPGQKCRVWTASYGGQKAMIIRAESDKVVNYTVLDVNEGSEAREADAFIAAYAKDGKIAGEFPSQAAALDKAFELCPEG